MILVYGNALARGIVSSPDRARLVANFGVKIASLHSITYLSIGARLACLWMTMNYPEAICTNFEKVCANGLQSPLKRDCQGLYP